jgi:transcriptional regulator with PAS, ATPase and Fis domain
MYPFGTAESKAHLTRAVRIAQGLANTALARDLESGFPDVVENAYSGPPAANLDSAVALMEVAGHPHILAREALALIEGSGCVSEVALIARGAKGVRVVETRGWHEREALQAARHTDTIETIDCGTHRDEALQIIAPPDTDIERRCTWIAIKKLVGTALTLDRYRRDEKQRAALWPTESLEGDPDILWVSEPVNEVVRVAKRIGPTPLTVLLTGETGVGKEMLAKTIHLSSPRADKLLLAFNCTAVPRDMLESQLFGYRRGAFTGADTSYSGVIRAAEGGTLFLDEIADMPVDLQPKLLRFLETHEIHPLGEPHPIKVDVRVIAATNANLEQLVAEGRFRQDLFYRLNVVRLRLPPLRERREEIPALVEHYIQRFGEQQKKGRLTLTDEALEYLLLYNWPGNLRQLANEVNRMVALAEPDSALTAAHLSAEIQATRRTIAAAAPDSELRISLDQPLPAAVELLERTMVQMALERAKGRLEEAAKILGISRKGLFLKRRRWGLQQ